MKAILEVQNLKCSGCASTISNKLTTLKHIKHLTIDTARATISFEYETPDAVQQVAHALHKLGYPLINEENTLVRKARSYLSCALGKIG